MKRKMLGSDFKMNPILYGYTGSYQTFTAPATGNYKIECWGAQGCQSVKNGYGAYTSGTIRLSKGDVLYIYCGYGGSYKSGSISFNGGGIGYDNETASDANDGGGATDVRLISGSWNDLTSLRNRIMVSAAGAGNSNYSNTAANGGGILGYAVGGIIGASQTSGGYDSSNTNRGNGGSFGIGGNGWSYNGLHYSGWGGGGGGGYYGGSGGGNSSGHVDSGSSGSCFISGHPGCNAINASGSHTGQPNHYSGKVFTSTLMIDGSGYQWTNVKGSLMLMPKPSGGTYASGTGHTGSGYCRISKAA